MYICTINLFFYQVFLTPSFHPDQRGSADGHHPTTENVGWMSSHKGKGCPYHSGVRAHAQVAGLVRSWGAWEGQQMDVSLSLQCFHPSLSPSPSLSLSQKIKNKQIPPKSVSLHCIDFYSVSQTRILEIIFESPHASLFPLPLNIYPKVHGFSFHCSK